MGRVNLNSALQLISGRLAKIDYPYENALVSGNVAIIGTASGDSFQNYVLEYGEGYSPQDWTQIATSNVPVSKRYLLGNLEQCWFNWLIHYKINRWGTKTRKLPM